MPDRRGVIAGYGGKGLRLFVSYGSRKSNLNRVVGTLCKAENIPCLVITALEDGEKEDTFNSRILERMEIQSVFCDKSHVRETVEQTLADLREKRYHPYYIYGDSTGKGNESAVRKAYAAAYEEIRQWEKQNRIYFRQIFHASGTGMTQGGLVAGQKAASGQEQIIGISVARNAARGAAEVARFAGVPVDQVCFLDEYLCGGYGMYEEEIERTIEHVMAVSYTHLDVYKRQERGQYAVLLKPRTDQRDGANVIQSRMGLSAPAEYVDEFLAEIGKTWSKDSEEYCYHGQKVNAVLVDEAQFLSAEEVDVLSDLVDFYGIPVLCYGSVSYTHLLCHQKDRKWMTIISVPFRRESVPL